MVGIERALDRREFWRINPWSKLIIQKGVFTVAETGGWFDIYVGTKHMTGTRDLLHALAFTA